MLAVMSQPQTTLPRPVPQSNLTPLHTNIAQSAPAAPGMARDHSPAAAANLAFENERVIKSGEVSKRSRRTKTWKKFFLVLRHDRLSIYKNESESQLLKQIMFSDLTAVAHMKDPKGRRNHRFGLFTHKRNYHFQAHSDGEADSWVDLIRKEARIDEDDDSLIFGSPGGLGAGLTAADADALAEALAEERLGSSSPDMAESSSAVMAATTSSRVTRDGVRIPGAISSHELDYSGNEQASFSDFSDTAPGRAYGHSVPKPSSMRAAGKAAVPVNNNPTATTELSPTSATSKTGQLPPRPVAPTPMSAATHNATAVAPPPPSSANATADDDERVVWHGHVLALKSKGGVRQWKKLWLVVRPKNVAFYKNEHEYSAHLLIPFESVHDAVEIDQLSRSKAYCFQIIAEEKSYRMCAPNEQALSNCLGALKSLLAKRKEKEKGKKAVPVAEKS